jgi:uncharacterized protein YndB with AHSA1/START domain
MADKIKLERFYNHPIQTVWAAISEVDAISDWFIQADFKPQVGYQYTFTHETTTVRGTVLEVNDPNKLVYTWIVGNTTAVTEVSWSLSPKGSGTQLVLEHDGFDNYQESAVAMFDSSVQGWQAVAEALEKYLAGETADVS